VIEAVRDFIVYPTSVVVGEGEAHEVERVPATRSTSRQSARPPVFVSADLIEQSGAAPAQPPSADTERQPPADIGGKPAQPIGAWRLALQVE